MKKLLLILLVLDTVLCVNAQQNQLTLDALTVQNGLPDNYPRTFVQDNKGYIWIGTFNGLVRYDGYNVKIYNLTVRETDNEYYSINCLFVDHEGVLWIAAGRDGFFRYNRKTEDFTQFKQENKTKTRTSISSTISIKEDKQGKLWILRDANEEDYICHLDQFNTKTGTFLNFSTSNTDPNRIPVNRIFDLIIDQAGRPWIGTDNGIYVFDTASNKFKGYLTSSDTTSYRAFSPIYEAPTQPGVLWMNVGNYKAGTWQGLMRFDMKSGDIKQYKQDAGNINSIVDNQLRTIMEDNEKRLWIGTGNGLSLFDRRTKRFTNYIKNESSKKPFANSINSIKEDRQACLWMASGNGLLFFNPQKETFTRFTPDNQNPQGLPTNTIREVFIDKTYNIWLSFQNRYGLQRINQERLRFTQYKNIPGNPASYPGGRTTKFVLAQDGTYWLAASTGLYNWNQGKNQFKKINLHQNPSENDERINDILLAKNGKLWGIVNYSSVFNYNPATGDVKYYHNITTDTTSLKNPRLWTIYEDKYGIIWTGSMLGGLEKLDSKTDRFTHISLSKTTKTPSENFLTLEFVTSMYEDRKGILWAGTSIGSLNRLDSNTQTFIPVYKEKNETGIWDIYEDSKNNFWLSSFKNGLILFDRTNGNTRRFSEKEGSLFDVGCKITEDENGFLWIASERGLSRLDTKNFTFNNFTTKQGLPEGIIISTPLLTNGGKLLIGTESGFFSFLPGAIAPNPVPPFINIEAVYCTDSRSIKDEKEDTIIVDNQDKQDLPYNKNRITFQYAGLHFTNAPLNKYTYKLQGYDNSWIQAGVQRSVTYNNLGPGTYTFMVKSANSDGVWNDKPASFTIIIHPPWWKTWWAYSLFALLFLTCLWAFIYYRSRSLIKEKRVLENKVTERTVQVLQQKEEIQNNLNELKSTQAQLIQSEKMASLGELTAGIAHEIQNPLNFVNNFSEVNTELIDEAGEEINKGNIDEAKNILLDIKENEQKINHHGKRADAIVKGMLQHSRSSSGVKEPTDINALCDEYLRLSYHGLRAKDKSFNATMKTDFDNSIGNINIIPQDIGRVILNLLTNAFYAVNEKNLSAVATPTADKYEPTVSISTKKMNGKVEIKVSDNGNGIPQKVLDKIFQPFFTTKPTGQGTGLGLSLSYDIIKAHGGELKVKTTEGKGTEFIIHLPLKNNL